MVPKSKAFGGLFVQVLDYFRVSRNWRKWPMCFRCLLRKPGGMTTSYWPVRLFHSRRTGHFRISLSIDWFFRSMASCDVQHGRCSLGGLLMTVASVRWTSVCSVLKSSGTWASRSPIFFPLSSRIGTLTNLRSRLRRFFRVLRPVFFLLLLIIQYPWFRRRDVKRLRQR